MTEWDKDGVYTLDLSEAWGLKAGFDEKVVIPAGWEEIKIDDKIESEKSTVNYGNIMFSGCSCPCCGAPCHVEIMRCDEKDVTSKTVIQITQDYD